MGEVLENFTAENKSGFQVVEESLPARLGISREVLRTLRQVLLHEGTHWAVQKKRVWLSEVAVALLEAGFARLKNARAADVEGKLVSGLTPAATGGLNVAHIEAGKGWVAIKTPVPRGSEVVMGTVVNFSRLTNPKVILARVPGGSIVLVRVNDRRFWRAGASIRIRRIGAGSGVWERVGRDPRFEGEKVRQQ